MLRKPRLILNFKPKALWQWQRKVLQIRVHNH